MQRLALAAAGLLVLGLGCGGLVEKKAEEPAAPAPPAAPAAPVAPVAAPAAPPAPVAPPVVLFAQAAFPCCGAHRANRMLEEYLDLQGALAADDLTRARAETNAVRGTALAAAKDGGLSGDSRALAQQIADLSDNLTGASLADIRGRFDEISDKMITVAKANRGGSTQVAVGFSPKANANWLQKETTVSNPYLGKVEATEGTFRE